MRVACLVTPALGHWHFLLPVLEELERRGHEWKVFTSATFGRRILSNDLGRLEASGRDWEAVRGSTTMGVILAAGGAREYVQMFTGELLQNMFEDALPRVRAWAPDLIVHDNIEFAAPFIAEALSIRACTVGVTPPLPASAVGLYAASAFRRLSQHFKISPQGLYNDYLECLPESLLAGGADNARVIHRVQPGRWVASSGETGGRQFIREFRQERPIVHLTFGSIFSSRFEARLLAYARILATLPINLVVTGLGAESKKGLPPHVLAEDYLAHDFLDLCDLVVCHAGHGTVVNALMNGVQMCLLPLSPDQSMTAGLCERAGVGRILATERTVTGKVCDPTRLTAGQVVDATKSMLFEANTFRSKAQTIQRDFGSLPTIRYTMDVLLAPKAAATGFERSTSAP